MRQIVVLIPEGNFDRVCGVYKITLDNSNFYIGSSVDLRARFKHWARALRDTIPSHKWGLALKDAKTATIEVLECCGNESLRKLEDFYLMLTYNEDLSINISDNIQGRGWMPPKNILPTLPKREPGFKPISILKTQGEWDVILEKINKLGKKDLSVFIRTEVRKLTNDYENIPKSVSKASGEKITKRPYIPKESYAKLQGLAVQMKIPVSSVVDRLIIFPLLKSD